MNYTIFSYLFILFGIYGVINPEGISLNTLKKSYTVPDLIQGWAIYSITIGLIIKYPTYLKHILIFCFIMSILWHINISIRSGITLHHKHSIIINSIVLVLVLVLV